MKRSYLKRSNKPMRRTPFKRGVFKPLRRTALRVVGHSTTSELKIEIQSVLRDIAILRDGGCVFRDYKGPMTPSYRSCGGFRKDGGLILQYEHLDTRAKAISFSDTRLGICICQRHHIFYKKQHPDEYYRIVREIIGKERSDLLTRVQNDYTPHKVDLKLELIALKQELKQLQNI